MTQHHGTTTRCDGGDLRAMFSAAAELFERNVDLLNRLNVFPVPDGDTGTNMYLTLADTLSQAEEGESVSAHEVAASMARGALWGAKGNSGVILSQFFKGLASGLEDADDFGPAEFAHALRLARDFAYKAVGQPREGTMLTVLRYTADAALEAENSPDMAALLVPVSEGGPPCRRAHAHHAAGAAPGRRRGRRRTRRPRHTGGAANVGRARDARGRGVGATGSRWGGRGIGHRVRRVPRGDGRGGIRLLHATAYRGRRAGLGRRAGADERDGALRRGDRRRGGAEGARPRRRPRPGHQLRRVAGNAQPGEDREHGRAAPRVLRPTDGPIQRPRRRMPPQPSWRWRVAMA